MSLLGDREMVVDDGLPPPLFFINAFRCKHAVATDLVRVSKQSTGQSARLAIYLILSPPPHAICGLVMSHTAQAHARRE